MISINNKVIMLALMLVFNSFINAQTLVQNIRGTVLDKVSQSPVTGATVVIVNTIPLKGAITDEKGNFKLNDVAVGKQAVKITFLGYKEVLLQNLELNSGKELVLVVNMEEDIVKMNQVEVEAKIEKNKPLNDMSAVSTRTFSVEETQKFAAAVNDPARMVSSFAGVVSCDDGSNYISIRGNSPNGLLWRMEGVEIPNPNHFAFNGGSGGGVSILSAQVLGNSDFSTGAFAAEYGNALSGVFDLKLRKGNNQKKEYTIQLGVMGSDVSLEGPFKAGYDGSYLINYRYSTLTLLGKIGVPLGDAITNFQDISMNIILPTKRLGNFSLFGFGGLSSQTSEAKKDSLKWSENIYTRYTSNFICNTGAVGLTNTKLFKNQSYLKTMLVFSGNQNKYEQEKMLKNYSSSIKDYQQKYTEDKITLSSAYTQKINAKNSIRSGFILNQLSYNLGRNDDIDTTIMIERINVKGNTQTVQAFTQWNYKLSPGLTTNLGVHYFQLLLNGSKSLEPRASVRYDITTMQNFTLGYGLHSQLQPLGIYFQKNNAMTPNKDLRLSKAHHLVAAYDISLNGYSHLKTELYYQHLFNIPISQDPQSTYSVLNADDCTEPLTNKGLGRNYGLELTYERFMYKSLYYLLTLSLYDSKYRAANLNWYNTRFNTNYSTTLTMGKEWNISRNGKSRSLGFNIKSIYIGGSRYTPIDLASSISSGKTKYQDNETFLRKNPTYYRLDIKISFKRNYKRLTSSFSLDIQNTTNRKNIASEYFDQMTGEIKYWYQTPLIPVLSYKLEF